MFFEKVPLKEDDFFIVRQSVDLNEDYPFHTHPEFELMLVLHSSGRRFVGNSFSEFTDFDLSLIGPNLPHKWSFEKHNKKSKVLVLQFRGAILEDPFFKQSGLKNLHLLLAKASKGIRFKNTKEIRQVESGFAYIRTHKNIKALVRFLNILEILSRSKETELLSNRSYALKTSEISLKKIDSIFNYILDNFARGIDLADVAAKFHMSKSGLCIFFKKHTGKNFSQFMNELRIGYASGLLVETDKPVSEICYTSGYKNLSYFNKIFRNINNKTPVAFRKEFGNR